MTDFKILRGNSANLPTKLTNGYMYFTKDDGKIYIDHVDDTGTLKRSVINAESADKLLKKLKIGDKEFDGSAEVTISAEDLDAYTKNEVDSKISTHTHNYAGSSTPGGAANSAVKLETARKIGVSEGVVGTATSFNGTSDISIPVTGIKEAYLDWGGKDIAGGFSPVDASLVSELGANRFAFLKASCIDIEYSNDGGATWTDYGATDYTKMSIFINSDRSVIVGNATADSPATPNSKVRITLAQADSGLANSFNKFIIYVQTDGSSGCSVTIQKALNSDLNTFTDVKTAPLSGLPGYNVINLDSGLEFGNHSSHVGKLRFVFSITSQASSGKGLMIRSIGGYGGTGASTPSVMAKTGHLYRYDPYQNAVFPGEITASHFNGEASRAVADGIGQNIINTYLKGISASGTTLTLTKGDGTTSTIQTQDTTYEPATEENDGLMTADQVIKLNKMPGELIASKKSVLFNDLTNNKMYGAYSIAEGAQNIAGGGYFRAASWDESSKTFTLNSDLKMAEQLTVGLVYSVFNGSSSNNQIDIGQITAVDVTTKTITVDTWPSIKFTSGQIVGIYFTSNPEYGVYANNYVHVGGLKNVSYGTATQTFGLSNKNYGMGSFVAGGYNTVGSTFSIIHGYGNTDKKGTINFITGDHNVNNGWNSVFITGKNNIAGTHYQSILGVYNKEIKTITLDGVTKEVDFVIGNGTSDTNRSNAFLVDEGGNAVVSNKLYASGASISGEVNMNSNKITNLLDPTEGTDAASKNYVDSNAVIIDENDNITGENDSAYGSAGLSWGQGGNKTGSKAFHITGFSGVTGGTGYYLVDGTSDDATTIANLISSGTTKYSLENDMHFDYAGNITASTYENGSVKLTVTNFYTNQREDGTITYDSNKTYSSIGSPYTYAPNLGDGVKHGTAYLMVAGHPELGSFVLNNGSNAFGKNNVVQADKALAIGNGNKVYGNYGTAHGKENIVGYDCHVFGRYNDLGFAQDSITMGWHNTVTNFSKWNALFGQWLESDKDFMAAFGSANRNLKDSVFEIGNGLNNVDRHNIFSVDKNGLIQTNETYLPAQSLVNQDITLNSTELVQGDASALHLLKPNALDAPKSVSANEKYFGYVEVKTSYLNLTVDKPYIMFVHLNISNVGGTDPVSRTFVGQVKSGTSGDKGLNVRYRNLQAGDNYIAMLFTPDGTYDRYGIYFDRTYNTSFTLTIKEVRVYELDKSNDIVKPYNFTSNQINKPYYYMDSTNKLYGAIVQDINLIKPYPVITGGRMYAAHWDGIYNDKLNLYSTNNYLEEKVNINHNHPTATPSGIVNLAEYGFKDNNDGTYDIMTETDNDGYITNNYDISFMKVGDKVKITFTISGGGYVYINDDIYDTTSGDVNVNNEVWEGTLTQPIRVVTSLCSITMSVELLDGKDGFMSSTDKGSIECLKSSVKSINTNLSNINSDLPNKANKSDVFGTSTFKWTDYEYTLDHSDSSVSDSSIYLYSGTVSINCIGETLEFMVDIIDHGENWPTLNVNGKEIPIIPGVGYRLQPTEITTNLIFSGSLVTLSFTDMTKMIVKPNLVEIPTSLKNPNALTVKGNGTTSFTYDGSTAKSLNIKSGTYTQVSSDTSGNITISASHTHGIANVLDTTIYSNSFTPDENPNIMINDTETGFSIAAGGYDTTLNSISGVLDNCEVDITISGEGYVTIYEDEDHMVSHTFDHYTSAGGTDTDLVTHYDGPIAGIHAYMSATTITFSNFKQVFENEAGFVNGIDLHNLQKHLASTNNPHSVTAEQINAAPLSHVSDTSNPHNVTAAQVGAAAVDHTHSDVDGYTTVDVTKISSMGAKFSASTSTQYPASDGWYSYAVSSTILFYPGEIGENVDFEAVMSAGCAGKGITINDTTTEPSSTEDVHVSYTGILTARLKVWLTSSSSGKVIYLRIGKSATGSGFMTPADKSILDKLVRRVAALEEQLATLTNANNVAY